MSIPDKAVEAAARKYYEDLGWDWDELGGWSEDQLRESNHEENKRLILSGFRSALEAAEPYLTDSDSELRKFAKWLIRMDEPESVARQTVTLTRIIERAREALAAHPEVES